MRHVGAFETVDLIGERNDSASAEVSHIVGVLGVNVYLSLVLGVVLFSAQEGVLEESRFFVPPADHG